MIATQRDVISDLRCSPWDYGSFDRRKFVYNHEGFFRLCMEVM
jgi:hypothetical protein